MEKDLGPILRGIDWVVDTWQAADELHDRPLKYFLLEVEDNHIIIYKKDEELNKGKKLGSIGYIHDDIDDIRSYSLDSDWDNFFEYISVRIQKSTKKEVQWVGANFGIDNLCIIEKALAESGSYSLSLEIKGNIVNIYLKNDDLSRGVTMGCIGYVSDGFVTFAQAPGSKGLMDWISDKIQKATGNKVQRTYSRESSPITR